MVKKPKTPDRAKKTAPVSVRLDPDTKAELERAARAEDRSLSNFIERLLKDRLHR